MARQIVNTGTLANDGTGDTLRQTATKVNANFAELYTQLGGDALGAGSTKLTDSGLDIIGTSFRTKIGAADPSEEISIDFPATAGNIVVDVAEQTLTNKTIDSATINNPSILNLSVKDADSSHEYIFVAGALTSDHNVNIPALTDSDTLVLNDVTATLTNKTLTTPTIHRPNIEEYIADSGGNPIISLTANSYGSTYNRFRVQNSASGDITLSAVGGSTNVGVSIDAKGNKAVQINKMATDVQTVAPGATIGSGGTDITASIIKITGATGSTITLKDAVVNGTILYLIRDGSSGTQTITPDNFAQGSTIGLQANETATLVFQGSNWYVVGGEGYGIA
jgi:hypothetical protein